MEIKSSVLKRPARFVGVSVSRYAPGSAVDRHGSFFRKERRRDRIYRFFFFASSECMSIHTYTFYTLHVSNAYFPKIYVMKHTLSQSLNRAGDSRIRPPLIAPFTRFYDPLIVEVSSLLSCRGFYISRHYRNALSHVAFGMTKVCIHDFVSLISCISHRHLARIRSRMATSININSGNIFQHILQIILQFNIKFSRLIFDRITNSFFS